MFWGCANYPTCKYASWTKPGGKSSESSKGDKGIKGSEESEENGASQE
jgi:ssDNA-binding Zn-finger/Zn-ribbon topoisomerase 1